MYLVFIDVCNFKDRPWSEFSLWIRQKMYNNPVFEQSVTKELLIFERQPKICVPNLPKDGDSFKKSIYELLQTNVGDKNLYIDLIKACATDCEEVGKEVYYLMVEQQLRLRCMIEEVPILQQ